MIAAPTPIRANRTYRGGPRNTIYDLTQNSVWRGVNGKIMDRQATILVPPHDGAKGLLRVTVTGHGLNGGKEIKTSPEVESFLGDYRLVTAGIPGTVTQTTATLTPAATPIAVAPVSLSAGTRQGMAQTAAVQAIVRHYLHDGTTAACGLRLQVNDRWTTERNFVMGCDVCVSKATSTEVKSGAPAKHYLPQVGDAGYSNGMTACGVRLNSVLFTSLPHDVTGCVSCINAALVAKSAQAAIVPHDLSFAIDTYEPGYIIRATGDVPVVVDTGSATALVLSEAVKKAVLPKPVNCGTVTVGHIRHLRYEPQQGSSKARIIATVHLIDSWQGKPFKDINVFLHATNGNVTYLELSAKSASQSSSMPYQPEALRFTISMPPHVAPVARAMASTESERTYTDLDCPQETTSPGYSMRSSDERDVVVTTGQASANTLRGLMNCIHGLPIQVRHNDLGVGTIERIRYVPTSKGRPAYLEVGLHLIAPWATIARDQVVYFALVLTKNPNGWNGKEHITFHGVISDKNPFIVNDKGAIIVEVAKTTVKEPLHGTPAPVVTKPVPEAALHTLSQRELEATAKSQLALDALKKKAIEDAKPPVCLATDEEVERLSTLQSMKSLGLAFGKRSGISEPPEKRAEYINWCRTQLSEVATLEAYRKEYAGNVAVVGSSNPYAENNATVDTLREHLGFSVEDTDMLRRLGGYRSRELSNKDADLKVELTLQQALRLLVRTEYKRCMAANK